MKSWQVDEMANLWNNKLKTLNIDEISNQWNSELMKQQIDKIQIVEAASYERASCKTGIVKMSSWPNCMLMKWQVDQMANRWNSK